MFFLSVLGALSLVTADIVDSAHVVRNDINTLADLVSTFNSQSGVVSALSIQSDFGPLSSAVVDLNDALRSSNRLSVQETRNIVDSMYPMISSLSRLLTQLTVKAQDFDALSLTNIVGNDVNNLAPMVRSIELRAFDIVPNNAPTTIYNTISDIAHTVSTAFRKVGSVYHLNIPNMPQAPNYGPSVNRGSERSADRGESKRARRLSR